MGGLYLNLDNEINKITSNKITKLYEISEEINKWTFVINKDFYFQLKESDEITWNSANDVKKDDIIFIYTDCHIVALDLF
jgi:hypothetical protein